MYQMNLASPLGPITLIGTKDALVEVRYGKAGKDSPNPFLRNAAKKLSEYFKGKNTQLSIKIEMTGTAFDQKVLHAMQKIPYGKTMSYSALAKTIGKPTAFRAVANACGRNILPIVIPCHRVVGKNTLGGYNGGIERKTYLLELETTK